MPPVKFTYVCVVRSRSGTVADNYITATRYIQMLTNHILASNSYAPDAETVGSSKHIFVFDVEATGLHGAAFAVGCVVYKSIWDRTEIDRFELKSTESEKYANEWVKENVIPHLTDMPTCETFKELCDRFYEFMSKYIGIANFYADCAFPVETNFLAAVVSLNEEERAFKMPYPLMDIANFIDVNIDRNFICGLEGLRKHNPQDDARASGACLYKYFESLYTTSGNNNPK